MKEYYMLSIGYKNKCECNIVFFEDKQELLNHINVLSCGQIELYYSIVWK